MSKLYLLSDVARLMRKRPHQITYAITSGLLPEPKVRMGGRPGVPGGRHRADRPVFRRPAQEGGPMP
jgi:hypothetical protein